MSDFTVNNTMAEITYELDEREIYNDIRSETGFSKTTTTTVIDSDPTYSWQYNYGNSVNLGRPGTCYLVTTSAPGNDAIEWVLENVYAEGFPPDYSAPFAAYYDYSITILNSDSSQCVMQICNTGSWIGGVYYALKYKYLSAAGTSHQESSTTYKTLTVRAIASDANIKKYGRRVMNLTWSEGSTTAQMQSIVDVYCTRYCEPVPKLQVTLQGKTNALLTQIFTREISDTITVSCTLLGLTATDFFLNSISINWDEALIPICTWGLEGKRAAEEVGIFRIDISAIDGTDLIG